MVTRATRRVKLAANGFQAPNEVDCCSFGADSREFGAKSRESDPFGTGNIPSRIA
jgi:hypothetical protein